MQRRAGDTGRWGRCTSAYQWECNGNLDCFRAKPGGGSKLQ